MKRQRQNKRENGWRIVCLPTCILLAGVAATCCCSAKSRCEHTYATVCGQDSGSSCGSPPGGDIVSTPRLCIV
ncbi:hypothetical protein QBC43DRAFT_311530 [Cladorrhinum sp. PSN259]|nr:hypothetical protein QBC43DRAFT_311530 [Cladorrhinum sp. PSN259]